MMLFICVFGIDNVCKLFFITIFTKVVDECDKHANLNNEIFVCFAVCHVIFEMLRENITQYNIYVLLVFFPDILEKQKSY